MSSTPSVFNSSFQWRSLSEIQFPKTHSFSVFFEDQTSVQEFKSEQDNTLGFRAFRILKEKSLVRSLIVFADPQVRGGTFTNENIAFLNAVIDDSLQLNNKISFVLNLNSGGVRLTHDRSIYNPIWGLLPRFFNLRKKHFFLTIANEKCLGAAAVFFAQGHFRIATSAETLINLTGQGVLTGFFGQKENFSQYASAGQQFEENFLVHEVWPNADRASRRVQEVLEFISGSSHQNRWDVKSMPLSLNAIAIEGEVPSLDYEVPHQNLKDLLIQLGDQAIEIMPQGGAIGRTFLMKRKGRMFGVLVNPPQNPKNLLNVRVIERYLAALKIFENLGIPLVSCVDSPGGDPRKSNSDDDIILRTLNLVEALIDYPHPKIGVIVGRCFGGVGMISLPVVHGSLGLYALPGARLGIMADQLIEDLVTGHARGVVEWEITKKKHQRDLSDLVQNGIIKEVLTPERMQIVLDELLNLSSAEKPLRT